MLTPNEWEEIGKQAINVYNNLELEIITEIAKRIANVGYANTVVLNDVKIAEEMGLMYQDIIKLIAKYNHVSEGQIKNILENAGAKTIAFDDEIYKKVGLTPTIFNQSLGMMQFLKSTVKRTNNNLNNLVMTTANSSQTQFYSAMNTAYLETSTGVKSYSQSIIDSIKSLSQEGAYITYPSGRKISLEGAVRMNIVTSTNQMCGKLQEIRADEMNCDLMEITAHTGARPEHAEWQGKIVSRSGKKGYLSFQDIGYGEITGFKGINCRHDWMPFYEGMTRTYTDNELEKINNETVKYNGQEMSRYDAEQIQRKIERQIRQDKKDIAGLQGILTSNNKDDKLIEETRNKLKNKQLKLKEHNSILNDFTQQTEIKKDNSRLYVGNYKNILNDNEKYAINKYVSSDFYSINEKLRNNIKLSSEEIELSNNLDRALDKMPTYKGIVTRSLDLGQDDLKEFIDKHQIDKIVEYKAYSSTTKGGRYNELSNVELYINSKTGKNIERDNPKEQEILFKRNSLFKVKELEKINNVYHILLEDINGK